MAKPRKKDKDIQKWKKKKWYPLMAPGIFNNQMLGETSTFEPAKVLGKAITVNLMNLTGEAKNQNVNLRLKVRDVKEGQGHTEVVGYTLSPAFIKRVVRRRHSRVDSTFTISTKDKKKLIVKPMIITRNKANRSEVTSLRAGAKDALSEIAADNNYDDFVKGMVNYRMQLDMRKRLSKLYPLKTFEIKKMNLVEKAN